MTGFTQKLSSSALPQCSRAINSDHAQTELGVIAEDWLNPQLQQITERDAPICYGIVQVGPFTSNGIPVLAIRDLNSFDTEDIHYASPEVEQPYARSRVRPDDVLVSVKGTTGRVGLVPNDFRGNISRDLARVRPRSGVAPSFIYQMLQSELVQRRLATATVGTTRMELSIAILKQVRLPLPPTLAEQEAVAEALSDVDGLLGALEKVIAKKRAIKQGTMQQLLTGNARLPGFSGEWEMKQVGEVADIMNGATPSTQVARFWKGTIPWCTPTDITGTPGKYIETTERCITHEGLVSCAASLLPRGSLLLCSRATIGEVKIARTEICTNQGFKSLVCKKGISNEFLYYLLLTLKPQMIERAIGSTFLEIGKKDVAAIQAMFPDRSEQSAIANVLSDMDAEIAALERRRDKTRAIKQGMMQQLLTGQVRLVKPEVAT